MSVPIDTTPAISETRHDATFIASGLTPAACAEHWPALSLSVLHGSTLGAVRDQGPRATCLAFAASGAHATALSMPDTLSPEWLFWAAKQIDGVPRDGTTPDAVRAALLTVGQPQETVWPYDVTRDYGTSAYVPPPLNGAVCHTHASSMLPGGASHVHAALDAGMTVVLCLGVTTGFINATATGGRIGALEALASPLAYHAVVAVGHGVNGTALDSDVVIRNSWGEAWGCAGYALVSAPYLRAHLQAAFIVS